MENDINFYQYNTCNLDEGGGEANGFPNG